MKGSYRGTHLEPAIERTGLASATMEAKLLRYLVRFIDRRCVSALLEAKFPPGTRPFLQPERLLVSFGLTL